MIVLAVTLVTTVYNSFCIMGSGSGETGRGRGMLARMREVAAGSLSGGCPRAPHRIIGLCGEVIGYCCNVRCDSRRLSTLASRTLGLFSSRLTTGGPGSACGRSIATSTRDCGSRNIALTRAKIYSDGSMGCIASGNDGVTCIGTSCFVGRNDSCSGACRRCMLERSGRNY